jgi:hypothetical protein
MMMTRSRRMWQQEAGVAMVTVLLIGAALTAVSSVAAISTIREFQAGGDDRRGSQALSLAEAGVDRMLQFMRSGSVTWGQIRNAGCTVEGTAYPKLRMNAQGRGGYSDSEYFQVEMEVFDHSATGSARFAPTACPTSLSGTRSSVRNINYFLITSEGNAPAARRVVQQVVQVKSLGLPVGIHTNDFSVSGQPTFENLTVIVKSNVPGRSAAVFTGTDPYYTVNDFWPNWYPSDPPQKPAGIYSTGTLFTGNNLLRGEEHSSSQTLNCDANNETKAPVSGQSQWDMSGPGGDISQTTPCHPTSTKPGQTLPPPPTSKFDEETYNRVSPKSRLEEQDYLTLKAAAQQRGLYCYTNNLNVSSCTSVGQPWAGVSLAATISAWPANAAQLENNFVAYFEFQNGATTREVKWGLGYGRCQEPPPANQPNQSATFVVRNGDFKLDQTLGQSTLRGALFVPEGKVEEAGSRRFVGSIIANQVSAKGSSSSYALDECWVQNMPGPFLDVIPFHFSEIDR